MGHRCGGSSVRIAWRASAIVRRKRLSTGKGVSGNRATALRNWRIENIWLTQKMMATLYGVDVRTINEHIKKIYSDSELEEDATIRNFRIVQIEGSRQVTRDTKHYNFQVIITVVLYLRQNALTVCLSRFVKSVFRSVDSIRR